MESNNRIKEYIDSVCNQIRWKKSHVYISNELENHITDQKDAFVLQGLDEDQAMKKAIVEMEDPIDVGGELDRIHRPKIEWSIIGLTSMSLLLGLSVK